MTMAQAFLAEFEQEAATTRRFLEQLGDDHLNWKPHDKSMTAGQLALHIAASPGQVAEMALEDEHEMPDFSKESPQPGSAAEVLAAHDQSVATVKRVLPGIDDQSMQGDWRVTKDGQEVMAMPRVGVIRSVLLNHLYHHRGQFGVYLRLLGATVPSAYGPSGDEMPDFAKGA